MLPVAENDQQLPQLPWFLIGVTAPLVLQSMLCAGPGGGGGGDVELPDGVGGGDVELPDGVGGGVVELPEGVGGGVVELPDGVGGGVVDDWLPDCTFITRLVAVLLPRNPRYILANSSWHMSENWFTPCCSAPRAFRSSMSRRLMRKHLNLWATSPSDAYWRPYVDMKSLNNFISSSMVRAVAAITRIATKKQH